MPFSNDYRFLDRLLHQIAFNPKVQKILCGLEDDLFRTQLEKVESQNPVFVTGLPRAGTTLVLDLLYSTGEFSTFTYRHMPFIMAPLLWDKISRFYRKEGVKKERAHKDGIKISFDSPEAFEEVIWLSYLKKEIVKPRYLSPLSVGDYSLEFVCAIEKAVKKLIWLDQKASPNGLPARYLSKNNANISRLGVITELFKNARIIVPFRDPVAHITSLAKQHKLFLEMHKNDKFSRQYMKWLGHYEFGENFKPINFDGWLNDKMTGSEISNKFWLEYWTNAYNYVLKQKSENVFLLDYDALLREKSTYLDRVARCVGINNKDALIEKAENLRLPTTSSMVTDNLPDNLLESAEVTYTQLKLLRI